ARDDGSAASTKGDPTPLWRGSPAYRGGANGPLQRSRGPSSRRLPPHGDSDADLDRSLLVADYPVSQFRGFSGGIPLDPQPGLPVDAGSPGSDHLHPRDIAGPGGRYSVDRPAHGHNADRRPSTTADERHDELHAHHVFGFRSAGSRGP